MLWSARPCFWFSRSTLKNWKGKSEYVPLLWVYKELQRTSKGAMSRQTTSTGHNPNKNENDGTNIYSVHRNVMTSQYAVIHLKPARAIYWTREASCSTRKVKAKICLPHHRRLRTVIIFIIITIIIIIIQVFDVFLTVHHSIDFSKYQLSAQFF